MHQTAQACLLAGTLRSGFCPSSISRRGEDVSRAVAQLGILRDSALAAEAQTWYIRCCAVAGCPMRLAKPTVFVAATRVCYHVPVATDSPLWLSGVLDLTWLGTDGTPYHVVDIQLLTPPTKKHAFFVARRTLLARVASTLYRHDGPVRVGLLFLRTPIRSRAFTWQHAVAGR